MPTLENPALSQAIARPVATSRIIKELGENGGGFFASNSATPWKTRTDSSIWCSW
ncbi:MAG UNVERIFIED_CONTAM: potassium-transporting ATPase subunit KdpA [Microcystis novacekii LVE1205-3]